MTQPDLVSNLIHIYKKTLSKSKRANAHELLRQMENLEGDWARQVITRNYDLTRNEIGQCQYCHKPAAGAAHFERHVNCMTNAPKAMYKLPKLGREHVCPICCLGLRSYDMAARHMLDLHSMSDFILIGIQPYMLSRVFKAGKAALQALYAPLEAFVTTYVFSRIASVKTSARTPSVASNLGPQLMPVRMADFILETSPELALLLKMSLLPPFTKKPVQTTLYRLDVDPATGLRSYFYPAGFFYDAAYACGGWVNLLRNFHAFPSLNPGKYTMTCSGGTGGVAVTYCLLPD